MESWEPSSPNSDVQFVPGSPSREDSVEQQEEEKQEPFFYDIEKDEASQLLEIDSSIIEFAHSQEWLFWLDLIFPRPSSTRFNILLSQSAVARLLSQFEAVPSRIPEKDYHPCLLWKKRDDQFYVGSEKKRFRVRRLIFEYCYRDTETSGRSMSTVKQECGKEGICIQPHHLVAHQSKDRESVKTKAPPPPCPSRPRQAKRKTP